MQKWEYKSLSGSRGKKGWLLEYEGKDYQHSELNRIMNELGRMGWELVSVLPFEDTDSPGAFASTYTKYYKLFFKRPIE
jgi:hypothetical protein